MTNEEKQKAVASPLQFNTRFVAFSDVSGIAKGANPKAKIETRKTIHSIDFYCSGAGTALTRAQMLTDIDKIIIKADSVVIREYTVQQLLDLYKHYNDDLGAWTTEGVLRIPFKQPNQDLEQIANDYAIGMLKQMGSDETIDLQYEITFKSPTTLTVDSIEVGAWVDDREIEFGRHIRIIPRYRKFDSTGTQDITDLPKGEAGTILKGYHFVLGSGVINKITVMNGEKSIYNGIRRENLEMRLNESNRKPQSGYFHLPFDLSNDPRSGVPMGSHVEYWLVQPNWTTSPGSSSYTILEEREHQGL